MLRITVNNVLQQNYSHNVNYYTDLPTNDATFSLLNNGIYRQTSKLRRHIHRGLQLGYPPAVQRRINAEMRQMPKI